MSLANAYMTDAVIWVQAAAADKWGAPVGDVTEVSVKARVDLTTKIVRNRDGNEVTAQGPILFPSEPSYDDRIRIDGIDHAVIAKKQARSLGDTDYWEVYVT